MCSSSSSTAAFSILCRNLKARRDSTWTRLGITSCTPPHPPTHSDHLKMLFTESCRCFFFLNFNFRCRRTLLSLLQLQTIGLRIRAWAPAGCFPILETTAFIINGLVIQSQVATRSRRTNNGCEEKSANRSRNTRDEGRKTSPARLVFLGAASLTVDVFTSTDRSYRPWNDIPHYDTETPLVLIIFEHYDQNSAAAI